MFTVLIRYQMTRREVLITAKTVEFLPEGKDDESPEAPGLSINHGIDGEKTTFLSLTPKDDENWRDVFVMNEQGQTVARYTL